MKYMKIETSFGGAWESSDNDRLPFRIDGLAYVYRENGKWFANLDMEHTRKCGPFDLMQDAMNYADQTLRFQDPRQIEEAK